MTAPFIPRTKYDHPVNHLPPSERPAAVKLINGELINLSEDEADLVSRQRAIEAAQTIRQSFSAGVDRASCASGDYVMVDMLKKLLTPDELARVDFGFFDIPRPERTVRT